MKITNPFALFASSVLAEPTRNAATQGDSATQGDRADKARLLSGGAVYRRQVQ